MKKQLLKDIVITVWDSLLAHKLRSALTLLGIIIGVTVVVLVGSILASLAGLAAGRFAAESAWQLWPQRRPAENVRARARSDYAADSGRLG